MLCDRNSTYTASNGVKASVEPGMPEHRSHRAMIWSMCGKSLADKPERTFESSWIRSGMSEEAKMSYEQSSRALRCTRLVSSVNRRRGYSCDAIRAISLPCSRITVIASGIRLGRPAEGFYDTAVAMPLTFEQRVILPPVGGLNKRQQCAEA